MSAKSKPDGPYWTALKVREREIIEWAGKQPGVRSYGTAAQKLGIDRAFLWKRCRALDLTPPWAMEDA